jgi:uncharacterized protein (DUF3084 family)
MSIGPSPSDENIDFKVRPRDAHATTNSSRPMLAGFLVLALIIVFAILFIEQRQLSSTVQQLKDLQKQMQDLDNRTGELQRDVNGLKQRKSR